MPLSKLAKKRLKAEKLRGEALSLKIVGLNFPQIAEALGITKGYAWKLVHKGWIVEKKENDEKSDTLKRQAIARLTRALPLLFTQMEETTEIENDDGSKETVPTHTPEQRRAAAETMASIVHKIALFEGSLAPTKTTLTNLPNLAEGEATPEAASAIVRELFKGHVAPPTIAVAPDSPPAEMPPPKVAPEVTPPVASEDDEEPTE